MKNSETISLLKGKIFKILALLLIIRLGLYIPIPNIDLDLLEQSKNTSLFWGLAKSVTGNSFLAIGSLGILPFINSSILIQLLTSILPALERLQKEEGEFGRQKLTRYTRYLTFGWAIVLSAGIAWGFVKPIVFNWNLALAFKIILSLTTGSLLSMWFAELITEEGLGNGSSMVIFINIIGSIPNNFQSIARQLNDSSYSNNILLFIQCLVIYLIIVATIVVFQDSYKRIVITSAKQLNLGFNSKQSQPTELKNSYIPLKLNQGGIMPLVFSSTIATLLYYPLQIATNFFVGQSLEIFSIIFTQCSYLLNISLIIYFSCFYAVLVLKPTDIAQNLMKLAYNIPGVRQGDDTKNYLEQTVIRIAFMGGLFLAFLAFFPIAVSGFFNFNLFRNVTSLLILVGVITDTTSQIRGFLVSQNYEKF